MKLILPLLLAAVLAGCAPAFNRPAFLATLVGQPETKLVRRLGVPSRTYETDETDGRKFLAYSERRSEVVGGGPFFGGFGYFGSGLGLGYNAAFPSEIIDRTCETTFEVGNGRVLAWSLRGNAC